MARTLPQVVQVAQRWRRRQAGGLVLGAALDALTVAALAGGFASAAALGGNAQAWWLYGIALAVVAAVVWRLRPLIRLHDDVAVLTGVERQLTAISTHWATQPLSSALRLRLQAHGGAAPWMVARVIALGEQAAVTVPWAQLPWTGAWRQSAWRCAVVVAMVALWSATAVGQRGWFALASVTEIIGDAQQRERELTAVPVISTIDWQVRAPTWLGLAARHLHGVQGDAIAGSTVAVVLAFAGDDARNPVVAAALNANNGQSIPLHPQAQQWQAEIPAVQSATWAITVVTATRQIHALSQHLSLSIIADAAPTVDLQVHDRLAITAVYQDDLGLTSATLSIQAEDGARWDWNFAATDRRTVSAAVIPAWQLIGERAHLWATAIDRAGHVSRSPVLILDRPTAAYAMTLTLERAVVALRHARTDSQRCHEVIASALRNSEEINHSTVAPAAALWQSVGRDVGRAAVLVQTASATVSQAARGWCAAYASPPNWDDAQASLDDLELAERDVAELFDRADQLLQMAVARRCLQEAEIIAQRLRQIELSTQARAIWAGDGWIPGARLTYRQSGGSATFSQRIIPGERLSFSGVKGKHELSASAQWWSASRGVRTLDCTDFVPLSASCGGYPVEISKSGNRTYRLKTVALNPGWTDVIISWEQPAEGRSRFTFDRSPFLRSADLRTALTSEDGIDLSPIATLQPLSAWPNVSQDNGQDDDLNDDLNDQGATAATLSNRRATGAALAALREMLRSAPDLRQENTNAEDQRQQLLEESRAVPSTDAATGAFAQVAIPGNLLNQWADRVLRWLRSNDAAIPASTLGIAASSTAAVTSDAGIRQLLASDFSSLLDAPPLPNHDDVSAQQESATRAVNAAVHELTRATAAQVSGLGIDLLTPPNPLITLATLSTISASRARAAVELRRADPLGLALAAALGQGQLAASAQRRLGQPWPPWLVAAEPAEQVPAVLADESSPPPQSSPTIPAHIEDASPFDQADQELIRAYRQRLQQKPTL